MVLGDGPGRNFWSLCIKFGAKPWAESLRFCPRRPCRKSVGGSRAYGTAEGRGSCENQVSDGRQPSARLHYQQAGSEGAWRVCRGTGKEADTAAGGVSAHPLVLSQNPSTGETEEKRTDENGILILEPAQRQHSGLYRCHSLDLETMITLSSDPQELLVNCEALGWRFSLRRGGAGGPAQADTFTMPPDVSDVRVNPPAPEAQEGDSLTLTCEAESNQDLEFEWLRDKVQMALRLWVRACSFRPP